ncbi:MAG: TonB-dependent receptor [Thermodesulfobacteriota bacterium]
MKRWLTIAAIISVLYLPGGSPAAEKKENGQSAPTMPEIIVTATRYEEEVRNVPANVSIITAEDINNSGARNIPEFLRIQAGVKVNDINGSGRSYTVDLRGFGETATLNTLVLVDGRRVNQADLSGTDWAQIPLDRVEKIEIIRGGRGSVLYGDNASGGVINIITREGERLKAGLGAAAGSYDTSKGDAYISGSLTSFSYSLSASYLDTDGYRDNSRQEAKDIGLNLNHYPSDTLKLNLSTGYHRDDTGLPGALKESDFAGGAHRRSTINPNDFAETEDYYFKGGPDLFFLGDNVFKFDLAYRVRNTSSFASFVGGSFTADTEIETISASPRLVLKKEFLGMPNTFSIGFDFENITENIVNDLVFPPFSSIAKFELKRQSYGYYFYDDFKPLSDLSVTVGFRRDRADFDFDSFTAPAENVSADEDAFTAGTNYTFAEKSYAYFSFSRSFRYPVLDEFFDFTSNTVNTALKPQESDGYELGMRYFFNGDSYVHLNLFRLDTVDEIFLNPTPKGFGITGNDNMDGETRREGVEISFNTAIEKWIALHGGYTYTYAKIRGGSFKEKDIPDVPNHQAVLGTVFFWQGASLAVNGIYIGRRPFISDFENTFDYQKDYLVFNAKLKYPWKMFTFYLDINNITDEEYSEYGVISLFSSPREKAWYPSPERNILAGVRFDF